MRPDDVASIVVKELVERTGIKPELIEDIIVGCAFPEGEQGFNLARMITFLSGLPNSIGGVTINRFCGSSMQAIHDAAGRIEMGAGDAFICGGVESMSRVPMTGFNPLPHPGLVNDRPEVLTSMGITAENLAESFYHGWHVASLEPGARRIGEGAWHGNRHRAPLPHRFVADLPRNLLQVRKAVDRNLRLTPI